MKKAVITGSSGFIGTAITRYLLAQGIEVIGLDKIRPTCGVGEKNFTYIPMELAEVSTLKTDLLNGSDVFYHIAWQGSAVADRGNTILQLNNAQWTIDCLQLAEKVGCKRFVAAGSIMEKEALAASLEDGRKPGMAYIYGDGKLAAHTMSMSVAADLGVDLLWATITNSYGAGEISSRFINTTIKKILCGEKLQFTSATQNYDFVYISDVAKAFYLIGEKGNPFSEYIIGSSNARPLKEFILEIKELIAPDGNFIFGSLPYTGVNLSLSVFDCSKTEKDTGFRASVSFSDGITKTAEWIKQTQL